MMTESPHYGRQSREDSLMEPVDGMIELKEIESVSVPSLTVSVDFNLLLSDEGEPRAFDLIGKLKDLLG